MARRNFKNVSVALLEYAEEAVTDFENRGYKISIEKRELGFPYTPTLLCKQRRTTVIVELFAQLLLDRIREWVLYARSSGQDTRVAICLPPKAKLTSKQEKSLREQKVGLYRATGHGLEERIPTNDLALNVQLPLLNSLPNQLRSLLGPAYDQFNKSYWREGFEDACQAFENEARRYLKAGCRTGRITIMTKKGPKNPTIAQINKMTMGTLAKKFSDIQSQNYADAVIGKTLKRINQDRVGVVHHKSKLTTEKRLRANVGQHMWAIVAAMKEMI